MTEEKPLSQRIQIMVDNWHGERIIFPADDSIGLARIHATEQCADRLAPFIKGVKALEAEVKSLQDVCLKATKRADIQCVECCRNNPLLQLRSQRLKTAQAEKKLEQIHQWSTTQQIGLSCSQGTMKIGYDKLLQLDKIIGSEISNSCSTTFTDKLYEECCQELYNVCGEVVDLQSRLSKAQESLILPDGVSEEFKAFIENMATEYNRHRIENGDSWKTATPWYLHQLLKGSYVSSFGELEKNPSHLLDIANFCWFLWVRFKETSSKEALGGEVEKK